MIADSNVSAPPASAVRRATLIGSGAILIWSTLALFTTMSGTVPPFQLVAMAFAIAFALGLSVTKAMGRDLAPTLRQPWPVWALGVGGLFGYHVCYFLALRLAPHAAVAVNLLNYLWPLLIVVFSAFLPGERLRAGHVLGAGMGLAGTVLIVAGGGNGPSLNLTDVPGYAAAAAAAVIWAGYSVLSRRFGSVPTDAVSGFCLVTALLAAVCHVLLETTVWPVGGQWLVVLAIGLGPVGGAFFIWDHGVKRGNIQALGALSYATPLLSTVLLIAFAGAEAAWPVWVAGALIIGGAMLASGDLVKVGRRR